MKVMKVYRTATHPADPAQHIVLVDGEALIKRFGMGVCHSACVIEAHCKARHLHGVAEPAVSPWMDDTYDCREGGWVTLEQYVEWHQQKEDTS